MSGCKAHLKMSTWPYITALSCGKKIWKDDYCKRHHPDEKHRKQKERDDKKEELYQQAKQQQQLDELNKISRTSDIVFRKANSMTKTKFKHWYLLYFKES